MESKYCECTDKKFWQDKVSHLQELSNSMAASDTFGAVQAIPNLPDSDR